MHVDAPITLREVWEQGQRITAFVEKGVGGEPDALVIRANPEGYRSLARLMLFVAAQAPGWHIHIDRFSGLTEASMAGIDLGSAEG